MEMFQIKHGQSPKTVIDISTQTSQQCPVMQNQDFRIASANTVYHGSENISYLGSKVWKMVPIKTKEFNPLNSCKKNSESG